MSEVLKDKILDYALNAYIESRAKKRADTFIYESELRRHFKSNGDEIPDLLNLLSHPLSQTKYLTKHAPRPGFLAQIPFLCQCMSQLHHFDVVEGLLKDHQPVAGSKFFNDLIPGIV